MKLLLLMLALAAGATAYCQQDDQASAFDSAIALHDKGEYEKAIAIYDGILSENDNHYFAWHEKTLSLFAAKRYKECVSLCEKIIKKFPDHSENPKLYSNWGSSLDNLGESDKAIKVYNKGISKYPDAYILYLNRGITHYLNKRLNEAADDMKKAVSVNPLHPSAHQFLAYAIHDQNRMAAALSLATFLLLEPEGQRAVKNLQFLRQILGANVKKQDEKNISISLSMDDLSPKKKTPDDFHIQELTITMQSALDYDEKYKDLNAAQKLKNKMEIFCDASEDVRDKDFFKPTYLPLYKKMREDSLLETACYIMYTSSAEPAITQWLNDNSQKVEIFRMWLKEYSWKRD